MEQIQEFCQKWQITEFALFGFVLREDFRPDSDIDILITFSRTAKRDLTETPGEDITKIQLDSYFFCHLFKYNSPIVARVLDSEIFCCNLLINSRCSSNCCCKLAMCCLY